MLALVLTLSALPGFAGSQLHRAGKPTSSTLPRIVDADVGRFFAVLRARDNQPGTRELQEAYFDLATPGLRAFMDLRRLTPERLAQAIRDRPSLYAEAQLCARRVRIVKPRLMEALGRFRVLYPPANLPDTTILIGRGNPVGVGTPNAIIIGLEALCAWTVPHASFDDRLVHVIAHEYAHAQQPDSENPDATVLQAALTEGTAELVAELATGSIAYKHLAEYARGREREIEQAFVADIAAPANGSAWVYNGLGTREKPGDLGYWVGYRIARSFYFRSSDKQRALRELFELVDAPGILQRSQWKPGGR